MLPCFSDFSEFFRFVKNPSCLDKSAFIHILMSSVMKFWSELLFHKAGKLISQLDQH